MAFRTRIGLGLALVILIALPVIWRAFRPSENQATAESLSKLRGVQRYDHLEQQKGAAELAKQGEAAIPALARALKDKDSSWELQYDRWRSQLPGHLQARLPDRPSKAELRRAVAQMVYDIGPTASRALVGAIEFGLQPSEGLGNEKLLRALYWSIPESQKSVQILSNWLAHPAPGLPLFGMVDSREIWPTVPHLAPLLTNWLKLADTAGEAAEALSDMGTNALFAASLIAEVADKGYLGGDENAQLHMGYTPELATNVLNNNRWYGLNAIGRLGLANSNTLSVLQRATTSSVPVLRACAANALGDLGSNAVPVLPFLLAHLDETNGMVLRYQIEAIGKMGPAAREAIPALRKYSDPSVATNLPAGGEFGRIVRWGFDPPQLAICGTIALCQVNPAEEPLRVEMVADAFCALLPTNTIVLLRPMRSQLLPILTGKLQKGGVLLAYQMLLLDPGNPAAAECLRKEMIKSGSPARARAASWYAKTTGTTPEVIAAFRELLPTVRDVQSQGPLNSLREVGPGAAELAPQVQPLLQHEDRIIRMLAGKTLRSIAPAAMPPIIEN